MAKVNPLKRMQKKRTEQEMRDALSKLCNNQACIDDVDSPDIVIQDCIEEILENRQLLEEMKSFVQIWTAKFQRK